MVAYIQKFPKPTVATVADGGIIPSAVAADKVVLYDAEGLEHHVPAIVAREILAQPGSGMSLQQPAGMQATAGTVAPAPPAKRGRGRIATPVAPGTGEDLELAAEPFSQAAGQG